MEISPWLGTFKQLGKLSTESLLLELLKSYYYFKLKISHFLLNALNIFRGNFDIIIIQIWSTVLFYFAFSLSKNDVIA